MGTALSGGDTAIGKAMLAALPEAESDNRYPTEQTLPAMTANSIIAPAELKEHLGGVRERGVAFEYCESNEAAACVGAPVRDADDEVVAAMSIAAPTVRWDEEKGEKLARQIADGAAALSRRLGHRDR